MSGIFRRLGNVCVQMMPYFRRRFIPTVWLLVWLGSGSLLANVPGGGTTGSAVTFKDLGARVVLANGLLTATITKANAALPSLRFRGQEMAREIYYSMDGGDHYRQPSHCVCTVKVATPDMVDVGFKSYWSRQAQAFDIEVHYVLRRGATGLYSYALLTHPANYPATGVGEWRIVWKLSDDLLENIYVDDLRHWQMPNSYDYQHAQRTPIKEITQLTTGVMAGQYDCKYDFNAEYWDLGCWGHASDRNKIGGWIVLGSHEYFNDGPMKQDLNAAAGINHLHFGMDHYNGPGVSVAAGEAWQKLYGPFLLYCNANPAGGDACWADARAQAQAESAAWPYAWLVNQPAYPLAGQRGALSGRLVVQDALKPKLTGANAWVGVSQPPPSGNWQFESKHYEYWVKADAQGNFTIPNVRPGRYTFSSFITGAVGEYSKPAVVVTAGQTNQLGEVVWNVPHPGRSLAWEIGVPDRTAREYRHGTNYFHGYLWDKFGNEFSNPLDYVVGRSDWATDWNYAQAQYRTDGKPAAAPWKWRIHFNLTNVPPGTATLTLAIASAQRARISVFVNGEAKPFAQVSPSVQGGDALLREGIHAKYCVEYLAIPTSRLKLGENILTLALERAISADAHVMYDYLNLELP